MALTGTPLINDIEDFRAIWQFLGWIDDAKPLGRLMAALEETGLTPADPGFYAAARPAVIDMGIVRRRKVDVVADIPARRVADLPVELDGAAAARSGSRGRARRPAGRALPVARWRRASGGAGEDIDAELVRRVAAGAEGLAPRPTARTSSRWCAGSARPRPGWPPTTPRSWRARGKVVFFAKHVDVMDQAEEMFADRGIRYASIRASRPPGRATEHRRVRGRPRGGGRRVLADRRRRGVNLQVASNLVLAELSWTHAEQTQAIDRIHRIGQDEPVTAWRIIAAQTIDARIAELIDSKVGLAARALDGAAEEMTRRPRRCTSKPLSGCSPMPSPTRARTE